MSLVTTSDMLFIIRGMLFATSDLLFLQLAFELYGTRCPTQFSLHHASLAIPFMARIIIFSEDKPFQMVRKKGPVWEHFQIVGNNNSHPHVQCKYCSKDFQRAVPERMQAHLNKKCPKAPNNAKSQIKQQNTTSKIDNIEEHMSEEQISLGLLLAKALTPTREEVKMQTDDNEQLLYPSDIRHLGYCYQSGIGPEKDEIRTFELFKEAADKGDIDSINNLGKCYQSGIGIEKDEIREFELYKEAAKMGDVNSLYNLGVCYHYGIGTDKDEIKAFELN
ncbi:unnamed protein product [Rhizophagus irregularis]|nr:unnamed protein product [Rhizophagus irregularis]